ncbi:uncharacterized protein VTP21DRAFT_9403 [Calcarisporiella thermophila]|uniref:uncharacterized protein n=1 Tax=Calcarisporiella thermophila TaxID=911321 RepID=UPI00374452C1
MSEQDNTTDPKPRERNKPVAHLYAKPIAFVPASSSVPNLPSTSSDDDISLFYRSLFTSASPAPESPEPQDNDSMQPYDQARWHCDACDIDIPAAISRIEHERGTAHLTAVQYPSVPDPLHLTGENRGFRILQSSGWNYESGLGPTGEGRRVPIATRLKKDRAGIGGEKEKKRVTHTAEEVEISRVIKEQQRLTRKDIVRMEKRDRERRRAWLAYMNQ